jgi:hypothetical protein
MNQRTSIAVFVASLLAEACTSLPSTEWGEPVSIGEGKAQTFVTLKSSGEPVAVGIRFGGKALDNLPHEMAETVLRFPGSVKATPFDHFTLNWNPHGHIPTKVYDVPHFDFHFYSITEQEREEIQPGECTTAQDARIPNPPGSAPLACGAFNQAMLPPPTDMHPPDFKLVAAVAPNMGNHLIDLTAPEFNGEPFTHTYIWGIYGGSLIFFEPMITTDFLKTRESVCQAIKMPQAMPEPGWYPTRYCVRYVAHEDAYTVSLSLSGALRLREVLANPVKRGDTRRTNCPSRSWPVGRCT